MKSNTKYPNIFKPLKIRNTVFKNRIWTAPAGVHLLYGEEGYPNDAVTAYYAEKARGGAAVITVSAQNMDFNTMHKAVHAEQDVVNPHHRKFWNMFTETIHRYDTKVSLQLLFFGYHGENKNGDTIKYIVNDPSYEKRREEAIFAREQMEIMAKRHAEAAEAALDCGFDMLLLHFGHGLFVSQFLSTIVNQREDEFGPQSIENRCRFGDMIIDAIRERVGYKLIIEVRFSASELREGGYDVDDCIEMVKHFQDRIDIAHISVGMFHTKTEQFVFPTNFAEEGCNAKYAEAVKACPDVKIPVITLGGFQTPDEIEKTLAEGKADIVAMARGCISDAARVNKMRDGLEDEIIPCTRCLHCLDYTAAPTFACSVNPTVGIESRLPWIVKNTRQKKKVVIIGGGPAGMQAAITAAELGHDVTLIEKNKTLGGALQFSEQVSFKKVLQDFMNYLKGMVLKRGVKLKLLTEATPELLKELNPDAIIAAVGADAVIPPILGIDGDNVVTAQQCYDQLKEGNFNANSVAVIGGGLVGCETALHLAEIGKKVSLIEMNNQLAAEESEELATGHVIRERMAKQTNSYVNARCLEINSDGLIFEDEKGEKHKILADTVLIAVGMTPKRDLAEEFRGIAKEFVCVGDCNKATNIRNATRSGWSAAQNL